MRSIRNSIKDGSFPDFVRKFMKRQFPKENYPGWAKDALECAGTLFSHISLMYFRNSTLKLIFLWFIYKLKGN
jgi:hypothetical protein